MLLVLSSSALTVPALTFRDCIALVALAALLILFIVAVSKPTVYVFVSPFSLPVTSMPLPFITVVFVSLSVALIVTPPSALGVLIVTFAPAISLSLAKSLAAFCAIVSACFLFTASPSFTPVATLLIILLPALIPSLPRLTVCFVSVLSFGLYLIPSPFITVVSPAVFLNSAEVRPVRALASLIFSVLPSLALTPMLLSLRSVVAPPMIFNSLFV